MTYAAFAAWLICSPFLFTHLTPAKALIWSTAIPYLFLPERFEISLPALPDMDKTNFISYVILLNIVLNWKKFKSVISPLPGPSASSFVQAVYYATFSLIIISSLMTVLYNLSPIAIGGAYLPGLNLWDFISIVGGTILFLTPFILSRRLLYDPQSHIELHRAIAILGLVYSALMLLEVRLSPQLHNWIYGYHQHSFLQHIRDGFRPMVFLQHGLWVGFFIFMACVSAAALYKSSKKARWMLMLLWLFLVLSISRNLGAFAIGLLLLTVYFFTRKRTQIMICAAFSVSVLLFPVLRATEIVPIDRILSVAETISQDRAQSLRFRLRNEDILLERAAEKPWVGWGTFGRNLLYNAEGQRATTADGRWVLIIGSYGWLGYAAHFSLIALPSLILFFRRRLSSPPETIALSCIAAGNLIYMIPNATLTPLGLLVFGALSGYVYRGDTEKAAASTVPQNYESRDSIQYTRF